MLNLYISYTSYNVLLSLAIAAAHPEDENHMIIVEQMPTLSESMKVLSKIFPANNMLCVFFERANISPKIRNFFLKKHNLKVLEKEIKKLPPVARLYYIREWNVYTTYAAYLAEQGNPSAEFQYLEDGIYTYVEKTKKSKNCLERISDQLAYGSWHKDYPVPGTMRKNCTVNALFPELLPDIFEKSKQARIDLAPLMAQIDEDALAHATGTKNDDEVDTMIALDFNGSYTNGEEYRDLITGFITKKGAQGTGTAIKRHPADNGAVCFIPPGYPTKELDAKVPIELYYMRYRNTLKKIVGGLSTALLTARRMLSDVEIESIVSRKTLACDANSEKILNLFSSIGVKIKVIE